LAEDLRKPGVRVITVQADVSLADAVSKMVEVVQSELDPIDILINNAGIAITRRIDDLSEADFDRTIATNLKSVFLCTQAVLPMMRAKNWGRIVNISSGAARGAGAIGPHYNASKAGVEGLTRGYADGKKAVVVDSEVLQVDALNMHVVLHFLNGGVKQSALLLINKATPLKDVAIWSSQSTAP
jgi:NAD(P)-dependent dehydrogenase (short-subunit alcohol dehydrogenase family)